MVRSPKHLNKLHHFAWQCGDISNTIDFYERILGLPMVHKIEKDTVPSTGEYAPYKHIFFQMKDGSYIAFFELENSPKDFKVVTNCDDWVVHFAFEVKSKEDVDIWKLWLEAQGVEVIGPTNHDQWLYSIYFFDPNGLRLEITTRLK